MLKLSLSLIIYIITLYLIGDRIRLNPKIDKFINDVEGRYSKINELLEKSTVKEGLSFLRKIYGWLSVLVFAILFLIMRFKILSEDLILYTYPFFLLIFMGWFSIKWVMEHKKTVFQNIGMEIVMIFSPLLLGLLDFFAGTGFIKILCEPIYMIMENFDFSFSFSHSSIITGGVFSLFLFLFFTFNYLLSWVMLTPFFLMSVILVITPIRVAKFLSALNKNDTFFWFAIFVLTIATFWLNLL